MLNVYTPVQRTVQIDGWMSEGVTAVLKHVSESNVFLAGFQKHHDKFKNPCQIVRFPDMTKNPSEAWTYYWSTEYTM